MVATQATPSGTPGPKKEGVGPSPTQKEPVGQTAQATVYGTFGEAWRVWQQNPRETYLMRESTFAGAGSAGPQSGGYVVVDKATADRAALRLDDVTELAY